MISAENQGYLDENLTVQQASTWQRPFYLIQPYELFERCTVIGSFVGTKHYNMAAKNQSELVLHTKC